MLLYLINKLSNVLTNAHHKQFMVHNVYQQKKHVQVQVMISMKLLITKLDAYHHAQKVKQILIDYHNNLINAFQDVKAINIHLYIIVL